MGPQPEDPKIEDEPAPSQAASHESRTSGILRIEQSRANFVPRVLLRPAVRGRSDREIGRWDTGQRWTMVQRGFAEGAETRCRLYSQCNRPYARFGQLFLHLQVTDRLPREEESLKDSERKGTLKNSKRKEPRRSYCSSRSLLSLCYLYKKKNLCS